MKKQYYYAATAATQRRASPTPFVTKVTKGVRDEAGSFSAIWKGLRRYMKKKKG